MSVEGEESLVKQICFRVGTAVYEILDDMCFMDVGGKRIRVADISKYAREFMLKGMKLYLEERGMVEKYRQILEEKEAEAR